MDTTTFIEPHPVTDALKEAAQSLLGGKPEPSSETAGFEEADRLARHYGLRCREITLSPGWWQKDCGALLVQNQDTGGTLFLRWKSGHYIDVAGTSIITAELAAMHPKAWAVTAGLPAGTTGVFSLIRFLLRGAQDDILLILMAAGFIAGIGALIPLVTGWILNDIAPSGEVGLLFAVGAALFMASLVSSMVSVVQAFGGARLQGRTAARMTPALYDRLLNLPVGFFRDMTSGDLSQRISNINQIRQLVIGVALSTGLAAILSIFYFGVLLIYSISLAFMALALVSVYILIVFLARTIQRPFYEKAYAIDGDITETTYETVSAVAKLRSCAAEPQALNRWAKAYRAERELTVQAGQISALFGGLGAGWQTIATIILFTVIGLYVQNQLSAGSFIAFLAAYGAFQGAFVGLTGQMIALYAAAPLFDRARPLLEAVPETGSGQKNSPPVSGRIEINNVTFSYRPEGPKVLDNVSLAVTPGEHVAIVGGSGAGKSTLLRIMLGFEAPGTGEVRYDGQSLKDLDLTDIRRQFGIVLQSSSLHAGTILENIRGARQATLEECLEAVKAAGLARDLEDFPMGIHTPITEGGGAVSGGQRQRILIARALVGSPRILFFDEATSALDNRTQAIVAETLDGLDVTRITIAHRLSTVRHADRIVVMQNGAIIEQGSYRALMEENGTFAKMAQRQLTEEEDA